MLDSIMAMLPDVIVAAVILLCVGGASLYIYKAKKSGKKCIGCPYSDACASNQNVSCGTCQCHDKT